MALVKLGHLVGILLLTLTVGTAVPAAAQYPPVVGNGRVTRSEVKQCQCTQFSGDGFEPGTTITVYDKPANGAERVVATVTADNKGGFKVKVCFDEKSPEGEHTLIARGIQAGGEDAREVRATVRVEGTSCFGKGDEVHNPNGIGGEGEEEQPRGGGSGPGGTGSGDGSGPDVGGVGLPRTGTGYVLPGLLLGFTLVVTGAGVVHLTRRRRLVTL
jgi:hypothetical protein